MKLAIHGGIPVIAAQDGTLFRWPIVTSEDEQAVFEILRAGKMSEIDISQKLEVEWGQYVGTRYNLCHCNGIASLIGAMFGCGVGRGDEVICTSLTYWASVLPAMLFGATPVFADIRLYRMDHQDKFPASLHELVPAYLSSLPADPFAPDGRPFGYIPGKLHLYSVGHDGIDDGGRDLPANRPPWDRDDYVIDLLPPPPPLPATQPDEE